MTLSHRESQYSVNLGQGHRLSTICHFMGHILFCNALGILYLALSYKLLTYLYPCSLRYDFNLYSMV